MVDNLPAKSRSRGIQPAHTRNVMTKRGRKEIIVNKGVEKKKTPSRADRSLKKTPLDPPSRKAREGLPILKPSPKESTTLKKKLRWQDVLPEELKGNKKAMALFAEDFNKVQEKKNIRLQPYERVGIVTRIGQVGGMMSTQGKLDMLMPDGSIETFTINWQSSNGGLIEYLLDKTEKHEPVVVSIGNDDFIGLFVGDARPAEDLSEQEFQDLFKPRAEVMEMRNADGSSILHKYYPDGEEKVISFKSPERRAAVEAEWAAKGKDIFGDDLDE